MTRNINEEELSQVDRIILKTIKESDGQITTYKIAKKANISWSTANSHCYKLKSLGLLESASEIAKSGSGKKRVWQILRQ